MTERSIVRRLDGMAAREALAEYAHEAWAGWMKYLFSKCVTEPHQTHIEQEMVCILPAWAVERWQRQMNTPYVDLPDDEKESDRLEADRILEILDRVLLEGE